jgi:hypothetical protein
MSEMEEHLNDEFPKVERTEVEFKKKEILKRYIVSDEQLRAHFQVEINAIQLSTERKSKLKKEESKRTTYFWISAMAAGWAIALVLRTFIVVPQEAAPVEYVYQRPERKLEKTVEQRDTIYLISHEWLLPWNDINFPLYCGGWNFPDMWSPAYGYGFPNGTIPWANLVYIPIVDSTALDMKIEVNEDSLLVAKVDSSLQHFKQKEKTNEYLTIRELIAQEIDERVEKLRKIKRVIRAARNRNNENDEDHLVVDWKGKRFNF